MINIASIVFPLLSAFSFGLSTVIVGRNIHKSSFMSVSFIISVIGNVVTWPLVLLSTNLTTISLEAVFLFALAGTLHPAMGRILFFKGIDKAGVSATASIVATNPIFSSMLAVLILNETLALEGWIGIICVVIGVVLVERAVSQRKTRFKQFSSKGLVFPLIASLASAVSFIVRKHGMNNFGEPLLAVAIGYFVSFLLSLSILLHSNRAQGRFSLGRDLRFFWKAGIGISLAWIFSLYALSEEKVSTVAPLLQVQPLFVLFFSRLYLKESEPISSKLVFSTFLITLGVLIISTL